MNSIFTIQPYKTGKLNWAFDDADKKLKGEALVAGVPAIIQHIIGNERKECTIEFAGIPFPGHDLEFTKFHTHPMGDFGGTWYREEKLKMEGWLCPALLLYFETAPDKLYVRIS